MARRIWLGTCGRGPGACGRRRKNPVCFGGALGTAVVTAPPARIATTPARTTATATTTWGFVAPGHSVTLSPFSCYALFSVNCILWVQGEALPKIFGEGTRVLPDRIALPESSARDRLRRSRLYVPGSEPKYFVNAALHGADAIILDLEDSVHASEKDAARLLVRNALRAVDFLQCERMVRINQLPLGLEDLDEIVPESPDLILIPKVESPSQIIEANARVARITADYGITRPIWMMPILESALGLENAFAIAKASDQIVALTIGLEDYTADLGVVKTSTGAESLYARQRIVNAAHAAGVQAIDSVFGDVGDMEGLRAWGLNSLALGFEGMGCVHPLQIAVIHEAFAPTSAEIDRARKIVEAYNEAQQKGLGVVSLGSKMIDPPVVQRALKLMARAQSMGLVG